MQVKQVNLQLQWANLPWNNYLKSLHHLEPEPLPYKKNKKNKKLSAGTLMFFWGMSLVDPSVMEARETDDVSFFIRYGFGF